jgi:hypothetical protein
MGRKRRFSRRSSDRDGYSQRSKVTGTWMAFHNAKSTTTCSPIETTAD